MRGLLAKVAVVAAVGSVLAVSGWATGVAGAVPRPTRTVYVAPLVSSGAPGWSCRTAEFSSIQAAVEAAPVHGTVVVCPGVYHQSVTVDRLVDLHGQPGAVIDASGQFYGIGVATSWVTVSGFTVENADSADPGAPDDGIITAGFVHGVPTPADHVTITDNVVKNNMGSGIDVNSSSYSVVSHNRAFANGVGINMSDDLGVPASHNRIVGNVSTDNPGGCGIALADHTGVGIFDNLVSGNIADRNGLGSPSAPDSSSGSGIILADPTPVGGVYDNTVVANRFDGNGHAGVALHGHAPGSDFHGNVIAFNRIGTNNLRTDTDDLETTGVYLAAVSPQTLTVIANVIHDDHYGIFTAGPVTVAGAHFNLFVHVAQPLGGVPTYP